MEHLIAHTAWQNFFSTQMVEVEGEEEAVEEKLRVAEARIMISSMEPTVTRAKALRDVDPKIVQMREKLRELKVRRKALSIAVQNRDRCAAVLSRELTRRVGREPVQRRVDKYSA
jgi:hypothetical protein